MENQQLTDNYRRAQLLSMFTACRIIDRRAGSAAYRSTACRRQQAAADSQDDAGCRDAAIEVDMRQRPFQKAMGLAPADKPRMLTLAAALARGGALALALTNRHDLILTRYRLEDAERASRSLPTPCVPTGLALRPEWGITARGQ